MKRILGLILLLAIVLSCASIKERLAIKECKFSLISVKPYSFTFSNLKLDFEIKVDNPNTVDAVLDKFVYTFFANNTQVFTGTTGNKVEVPAKKSTQFTTTITLEYNAIGQAMAEAIRLGSAAYRIDARAYVSTLLGEISYPVNIELNQ
ncbi:MAG: LEA type 2 family protein [candidate division WOR-3 bacterium]|nr:MAG: LEA type 2 family protein [candidate division WOR-3 bacterium]